MSNLFEFVRMFLSYGLVYIVFIACIICAMFIGFAIRKNKNKKEAIETKQADLS